MPTPPNPLPHQQAPIKVNACTSAVQAGYPTSMEDAEQELKDINALLIGNEVATYIFSANSNAMDVAGIFQGDRLVVDRSLAAKHGDIVIASYKGKFFVRRLSNQGDHTILLAENPIYPPVQVKEADDFEVWGVVTNSIHKLC
jgi:DNA polymerase V